MDDKKALNESLEQLHAEVADTLAEGVKHIKQAMKKGDEVKGSAAFLNVVRQFLKDNHIESIPTPDNPMGNLVTNLPFDEDDDPLPHQRH